MYMTVPRSDQRFCGLSNATTKIRIATKASDTTNRNPLETEDCTGNYRCSVTLIPYNTGICTVRQPGGQIHGNGKVIRVTALVVIGDVEACLQRIQWRPGQSSLTIFPFLYKEFDLKEAPKICLKASMPIEIWFFYLKKYIVLCSGTSLWKSRFLTRYDRRRYNDYCRI